jgi:Nucleotidyltransferase of unknown function (DUF6036)
MDMIPLHSDFSAFLKLLSERDVRYLIVGGYAVGFHGYVRATADLDIWVPQDAGNSERLVDAIRNFGFDLPELKPALFLHPSRMVRMGLPPIQIEIATSILGVDFDDCYGERIDSNWDDIVVHFISLEKLKVAKRASGRMQDLTDLQRLDELE